MKRKKKFLSICLCFCMFALAGCGSTRELSEEHQNLIAEYSAGLLLRYEPDYDKKLDNKALDEEPQVTEQPQATTEPPTTEATEAPTATPDSEPATSSPGDEETPKPREEISLNQLYGVSGIQVSCDSYEVCREYKDAFRARDKEDYLLVVTFHVTNTTSQPLKVNLVRRQIQYELNVDGVAYEAGISMLENGGMNFLKTTIPSNSEEEAVLIFEIPKTAKNPESVTITVTDGDKASITKLR